MALDLEKKKSRRHVSRNVAGKAVAMKKMKHNAALLGGCVVNER